MALSERKERGWLGSKTRVSVLFFPEDASLVHETRPRAKSHEIKTVWGLRWDESGVRLKERTRLTRETGALSPKSDFGLRGCGT